VEGAGSLLFLLLFVVAFWLLLIRPQRKRQQELVHLQSSVQLGDEVMLSAGVFARVTGEVDDPAAGDCLLVQIAPGVEVKIARGAVMRIVQPPDQGSLDDPADEPRDV
jgi:preprotein translocase subunit YajC